MKTTPTPRIQKRTNLFHRLVTINPLGVMVRVVALTTFAFLVRADRIALAFAADILIIHFIDSVGDWAAQRVRDRETAARIAARDSVWAREVSKWVAARDDEWCKLFNDREKEWLVADGDRHQGRIDALHELYRADLNALHKRFLYSRDKAFWWKYTAKKYKRVADNFCDQLIDLEGKQAAELEKLQSAAPLVALWVHGQTCHTCRPASSCAMGTKLEELTADFDGDALDAADHHRAGCAECVPAVTCTVGNELLKSAILEPPASAS